MKILEAINQPVMTLHEVNSETTIFFFAIKSQIFTSRCSYTLVCLFYFASLGVDLIGGVMAEMLKFNRIMWQILTCLSAYVKQSSVTMEGLGLSKARTTLIFALCLSFCSPSISV